MERPTPEMIVAALRCEGRLIDCQVKDCRYNTTFNLGGNTICKLDTLRNDAADLIEILCGRRAG